MDQVAPISSSKKRSGKDVTTLVCFRIAGRMKTEEDCFMGLIGSKSLVAATRMTVSDMKEFLAFNNQVPLDAISLVGRWGEREAREKAAAEVVVS